MTLVFVLNQDMNKYVKSFGKIKTALLDNPVDLEVFHPLKSFSTPTQDAEIHAIYIANIDRHKNQNYLLEIAKYLPDNFFIDLVGGHPFSVVYYREFKQKLRQLNSKNVIYHGRLNPNQIADMLRKSDLYISSSLLEGQSLAQIEALATGLPIVRLYSKQTASVTEHNHTAIHLPVGTPPRVFAKEMARLISNQNKYLRMRASALQESRKYSQEEVAKRMLAIIQKYT